MKNVLRPLRTTVPAPAVTVAMSMRNASRFLRECIDSVLSQSFTDFEFLIVDDGSTDDSVRIVRSYSDPRIRLICRPHDFIASLNTLLDEARGRYIARMDADDIMLPHRLQEQVTYLDHHPDVAAVASNAITIDENSLVSGRIGLPNDEIVTVTPRMMCEDNAVCNPSTMMRSEAVKKASLRYESSFVYAEDYRFWCRFLLDCGRIDILPQPLVRYRRSPGQVTSARYDEMMAASERIRSDLVSHLVTEANPGYADPVIEKTGHELTLIIPFLNEGKEVEATVRSFREFGGDRMDVIVINDCSYDSYPYMERLRAIPGVTYILNRQRLGVAACRDKGVALCRTPYFLLLDAHMRAYDDSWLNEIPRLLRENDRRILCCQTKPLNPDGTIIEKGEKGASNTFGAFLKFDNYDLMPGIKWIMSERNPESAIESIPAILGAGYGISRRYWCFLDGLNGLTEYGCDEQFLSLKTWMEGGECLLLKNIRLGHIYREEMPYSSHPACFLHNSLVISELLFPYKEKCRARANAHILYKRAFQPEFKKIREYHRSRLDLSEIRARLSTRNFKEIIKLNNISGQSQAEIDTHNQSRLPEIYQRITTETISEPGLENGAVGIALWLYHYYRLSGDEQAIQSATGYTNRCLTYLTSYNDTDCNISFSSGLSGIGWALLYLNDRGFTTVPEHYFSLIDNAIFKYISKPCDNWSLLNGAAGILAYIISRVQLVAGRISYARNFDKIDLIARDILSRTNDASEALYGMLWLQAHADNFTSRIEPSITDWALPSNYIPVESKFWSMNMIDGVLATSINLMLSDDEKN